MPPILVSFFVVSVVLARTYAGHDEPECEENSEMRPCGSLCESTCDNPEKRLFAPNDNDSCENECQCIDGYVRNYETKKCCKVEDCPMVKPPQRCHANEHFALCGRHCEPTCGNPNPDSMSCSRIECSKHTRACRCKKGYARNTKMGTCCKVEDCPVVKPPQKCHADEQFALCGRHCEPTCGNPNPDATSCPRIECTEHTRACRCKEGHVRNSETGECCKVKECPMVKPPRMCNPGFFRNEETNMCVPVERSPKRCAHGEIFATCGRLCEATCGSADPPKMCKHMKCFMRDCRCNFDAGFVMDEDTGKCIRKEDCSCNNG